MVGSAIAADLCQEYHVSVVDVDAAQLELLKNKPQIQTIKADISNLQTTEKLITKNDLVVGAVPGSLGFNTLKTAISTGKNIVDISFFEEDPFELDTLAKRHNVTAVIDCGVAPGMSNVILGYHAQQMNVEIFECLVGGLPFKRSWPFQYKAPFSPVDVIEVYLRPARIVENGKTVTKPALSDREFVDFEPVGTLESFNTDGLRTLLQTMKIPNMTEKTLRYPGHIEYICVLRESGFFDKEPMDVGGTSVRPIDLTARLLFSKWKLQQDEPEFTVMRITIRGKEKGQPKQYIYNLYDQYDEILKVSSMARTTGYTCSAVARLVLDGNFTRKGICPPEYIGQNPACFKKLLADLKKRGVNYIWGE